MFHRIDIILQGWERQVLAAEVLVIALPVRGARWLQVELVLLLLCEVAAVALRLLWEVAELVLQHLHFVLLPVRVLIRVEAAEVQWRIEIECRPDVVVQILTRLQAVQGFHVKTVSEQIRHVRAAVNIQEQAGVISALVPMIVVRKWEILILLQEVVATVQVSVLIRVVVAVRVAVVIAEAVVRAVDVQAVVVRDNTSMNNLYWGHVIGVSSLNYKV